MVDRLRNLKNVSSEDEDFDEAEVLREKGFFDEGESGSTLDILIAKFEEESKPAVLFFDEIIRAAMPILNLLQFCLTRRSYQI